MLNIAVFSSWIKYVGYNYLVTYWVRPIAAQQKGLDDMSKLPKDIYTILTMNAYLRDEHNESFSMNTFNIFFY